MNNDASDSGTAQSSLSPGTLAAGWRALRTFYRPFLLIQLAAALLVIAYYGSARVRDWCVVLANVKTRGGLPFAAAAAALAGGLLPEVAKLLSGARSRTTSQSDTNASSPLLFNLAFFAFNGVVIDLLYRGEARLFGHDAAVATIAAKVAFDQFVFTPVWLTVIIALYLWQSRGFVLSRTLPTLRSRGFYRQRVLPLLIPDWMFWIPMVCVIYALPSPLQFLLFIFALGAWSLIMVSIATPEPARPPDGSVDTPATSADASPHSH